MFYHLKNKSQCFSPCVLHKHCFLFIFILFSKSIMPLSFHWNKKLSLNYTGMDYKSSYPSLYMFLFLMTTVIGLVLHAKDQNGFYWVKIKTCKIVHPERQSKAICTCLLLLLLLSRFSRVWLHATPLTAAHQAPLSLGFSRQERWSGLPFPSPMHMSSLQ